MVDVGKTPGTPDVDRTQALALNNEPEADVERYDGLRDQLLEVRHAS